MAWLLDAATVLVAAINAFACTGLAAALVSQMYVSRMCNLFAPTYSKHIQANLHDPRQALNRLTREAIYRWVGS